MNLVLIVVWGTSAFLLTFVIWPRVPLALTIVGAALGATGGILQHLSIRECTRGFTDASSLLDIRRAFRSTSWGSRYIAWLYFSKLILIAVAFLFIRQPLLDIVLGYLAGYMALMFSRELVTLRDTFYLQKLASQGPSSAINDD